MPPTQFRMQDDEDDDLPLATLKGTTVPPVPAPAAASVAAAAAAAAAAADPHASGSQVRQ